MDGLAFHPYPDNSSQSPDFPHPRSTSIGLADYGKLVALLGQAFDGTAQAGLVAADPLRRVRDRVDGARREARACTRAPSRRPRSPWTSASRRRPTTSASGSRSASPPSRESCSSTPRTRRALPSWQSGVYYADGTPKASFWAVRDSLDRTRGGSIAHCDGMALEVSPLRRPLPGPARVPARRAQRAVPLLPRLRLDPRGARSTTGALAARVNGYGARRHDPRRVVREDEAREGAGQAPAHARPSGQPGRAASPSRAASCACAGCVAASAVPGGHDAGDAGRAKP